ncbi:MAG TPA: hypothetical protein VGK35_10435, partial [Actinotalea sp.]
MRHRLLAGAGPLVLRRSLRQRSLLGAVLAVVVAGATLLGLCALLLTTAQDRTLAAHLGAAAPQDVEVSVLLGVPDGTRSDAATGAVDQASERLLGAVRPFASAASVGLISALQFLPPADQEPLRRAYLEDADELIRHSSLVDGRWPDASHASGALEVAVPVATATRLGLRPGSEVALTAEPPGTGSAGAGSTGAAEGRTVLVVVGTFTPERAGTSAWTWDLLGGTGYDPEWLRLPAYGPFVTAPDSLLPTGVAIDRARLVAQPDLSAGDPESYERLRARVGELQGDLDAALGDQVASASVHSALGSTLVAAGTRQGLTASVVLVTALLGVVLAGTALGLTGRLVWRRRAAEAALLTARGAARRQLVAHSAVEAVLVAAVASALAIPLAVGAYAALGRLA